MSERISHPWRRRGLRTGVPALVVVAGLSFQPEAFSAEEQAPPPAPAVLPEPRSGHGDDEITFSRDVAPIVQENCVACHRPGSLAPASFMTYEEVRAWGPLIKEQVVRRNMPPYHYDTDVGVQALDSEGRPRRLTDDEIETIVKWVEAGMPRGDPADLPEPREEFTPPGDGWRLAERFGEPDHVIASDPYTIPAEGQDIWWRPTVESGLEEDRCIEAIEVKPSRTGWPATHHANSTFQVRNEEGEWVTTARLTEYALGKLGEIIPEDACRIAPAGSRVSWDVHYYPMGERVEDDVVEVGLWFHDDREADRLAYEQTLTLYFLDAGGPGLRDYYIPPHGTLVTQGFHSFDHPVRIDSFQPHGHLHLAAKKLEIYHPDTGERELVSQISNWNPGWHLSHVYAPDEAPLMPAGSVMIITAWYDNTENNPWNPDPDQWVGPGDRTVDEMSHAWIAITHLDDEGYGTLAAEREQQLEERRDSEEEGGRDG